jgi:L-methionine (R)-S-oxide reductase
MQAESNTIPYDEKAKFYHELRLEISGLVDPVWFTSLANCSSAISQHLPDHNWVGFYLYENGGLVLGPFQGKPACVRIEIGRGVCGTAVQLKKTIRVDNVDEFPGHIVCDSASKSELVIPLIANGRVLGVLDLDSPSIARFTHEDEKGFELIVKTIVEKTLWPDRFFISKDSTAV